MFLADAVAVSPFQEVLNAVLVALASVVTGAIGFAGKYVVSLLRAKVQNKRLADGLVLLEGAAERGAVTAYVAYTEAIKKAKADGKLTSDEAAEARRQALEAAKASVGTEGMALLKSVFSEGLDKALSDALERKYAEVKPDGSGSPVPVPEIPKFGGASF